jgi:uncharacterized membrane protein
MKRTWAGILFGIAALPWAANAGVTFEIIGPGYATAISADGSAVAGNTQGDYETFRWTEEEGIVPLGRATVPVLGSGAGTPDISADGTRISATILGADSTYITQGRSPPSDGGILDNAYGSAWGISDDGEMVVGLYWRPGQPGGLAHPCYWTKATGVVDLGTSGGSGRANDANADGSVIVGWEENPAFGNWWPTVWVGGDLTNLSTDDAFCEATTVNPDGNVIGGCVFDEQTEKIVGALWRWNGSAWEEEILGALPGHHPNFGTTICNDMTPDASLVVGYDRRSNPGDATGFLWTEGTGIIDVADFLDDNGVTLPANFVIRSLTGVSDDGRTIAGSGEDIFFPFTARSFVIRLDTTVGAPAVAVAAPSHVRMFPNPTRGAITLSLDLSRDESVAVDVYDSAGRLVRRLFDGTTMSAGNHDVSWDVRNRAGRPVAPGVYYFRVQAGEHRESKRLVVVR